MPNLLNIRFFLPSDQCSFLNITKILINFEESWSCEKAAKLTKAFGIEERGQQNFGLFLEDYADVSLLGVELLQTSNDTIGRISLCDNYQWKVDILVCQS